jgi:uncharacterized protein
MERRTRDEHLFGPGPKRILALDGGGIRGVLTLGFLQQIETMLRQRAGGDPDFRLSDYFDLIAGTSTGSIIAAGLAIGLTVEQIQEIYRSLAEEVFKKPVWRFGVFSSKFPLEPLMQALTKFFDDITLGSADIKTGLMVMTKRLDTGSPWVIHNNPRGKFFDSDGSWIPNKEYLLREVVRASTAAPHYFEPESIRVAADIEGAFVDGGVSPFNNPALQALMLATLKGFGLNWPFGADKLMVVSVGTGSRALRLEPKKVLTMPAVALAGQSVLSIMADCDWLNQTILQWLSRSPTAWPIDSEIKSLDDDILGGGEPLLHYLRYNVRFESDWLQRELNLAFAEAEVNSLFAMDQPKNVENLAHLGATAGLAQVKEEHFPTAFDPV